MIHSFAARPPRRALFVLTVLTGSFLLFLVQPMVARMALPRLGGAPAVWNSAMLVYQALLLGGYAYAHAIGRWRPRTQAAVHLGLLAVAALWLPIGLMATQPPPDAQPALWVPWLLGASIGPLFLAVSAQAPLIQRWFSEASDGADSYALYAASNLGSFGGLIAYPLLVEPLMPLREQSWLWSAGYVLLALLVLLCARSLPSAARAEAVGPTSPRPARATVVRWIMLALVPSGLMLATSTFLTTDIVAGPLLWVLPLGLYLLSFTVAFAANRAPAEILTRIAPVTILLFGGVMVGGYNAQPLLSAGVALVLLFMTSVALHTAMYDSRPEPDRLTGFYLAMSLGGVLGGVFAGLLAPVLFDWTYEYPLLILAAGLLTPQLYLTEWIKSVWTRYPWPALAAVAATVAAMVGARVYGPYRLFGEGQPGLLFIAVAGVGLLVVGARAGYMLLLGAAVVLFGGYRSLELSFQGDARTRSYFGVYTIKEAPRSRELDHGTTVHGVQLTGSPERERTPTTYYARGSGVGQAMLLAPDLYGAGARIGVVGLGTGTLSCYARPGQHWRFYEIDPAVIRIARDTGQFTYLRRCLPNPSISLGDARLRLAQERPASFDLLALDAFSSDAVPAHLLTREAFATYARVLSPRGLLLVHISNRYLDLEPVVANAAAAGGWAGSMLAYDPSPLDEAASGSAWIALSRDGAAVAALTLRADGWRALRTRRGFRPWTDDYHSILPLLKRSS
ncbi:spermidine synthase [uncultured Sphingomonas sp.]|uniref:spermidine synthase n=1 Tax=uncultured Sphingomonas sp. TaxID=158754 RepID=UPI0035C9BF0F